MSDHSNWSLKGNYFESCNCDLVCPCIFLMPPTQGHCKALVAWHIAEGKMEDTRLDNLNVAIWLHSPGSLTDGNWRLALYIDERANEAQKDALTQIYGGQAGGHPAVLAGFVTELMGVKTAKIEFTESGKKHHLIIKDVAENEMYSLDGEDGGEVKVTNHPLAVSPANAAVISKSKTLKFKDYDVDWAESETVGLSAAFFYQP